MISIALGTKSNVKILYLFSQTPGKAFNRKEIQQLTKLANNPINESLKFLVNSNILTKEKRIYKLNFENDAVNELVEFFKKEKKRLKNLSYRIWLILFDLTTKLLDKIEIKKIYLFGSYAKLIAHAKSDVDIAIIIKKREPKIDFIIEKIVSQVEKKFEKKIQVHLFEEKEIERKTDLVREILKDNIQLI